MFCSACGKTLALQSKYCSECGLAVVTDPMLPGSAQTRLLRPRSPRMIAGVCSAFAQHYGWDLTLTRIVLCIFTLLTSGAGILCYLAAWVLVPEEQTPSSAVTVPYSSAPQPPAGYGSGSR